MPSSSVPGTWTARIAASLMGSTPSPRRDSSDFSSGSMTPTAASTEGTITPASERYPSAEGWNWSGPKSSAGAAANSGPSTETVRPPSSMTAIVWAAASRRDHARATCLSGGAMGLIVPRSGQVPTTTATPASLRRRTPSARCRTDVEGDITWVTSLAPMRITATSGCIGSARVIWSSRSEERAPTTAKSRR